MGPGVWEAAKRGETREFEQLLDEANVDHHKRPSEMRFGFSREKEEPEDTKNESEVNDTISQGEKKFEDVH